MQSANSRGLHDAHSCSRTKTPIDWLNWHIPNVEERNNYWKPYTKQSVSLALEPSRGEGLGGGRAATSFFYTQNGCFQRIIVFQQTDTTVRVYDCLLSTAEASTSRKKIELDRITARQEHLPGGGGDVPNYLFVLLMVDKIRHI